MNDFQRIVLQRIIAFFHKFDVRSLPFQRGNSYKSDVGYPVHSCEKYNLYTIK